MTRARAAPIMSYPHGMLDAVMPQLHSEILVGRDADLAALRDALKRTRGAEPSTVLLGGEAGVGKTRLVEEFCRSLAGEHVRVLTGGCLELGEEGLSFAPFTAAMRELLRVEGAQIFDGHEREFASLLPELGPPPELGSARRGLLFESVGALLGRLSERQPVVLVIEDLHWADRSTRDLIGFLVRSVRLPRVLIVTTYRTDELHRGHPMRPFLGELDRLRGVLRVELDRLDRDGTAVLLGHLLGAEPDAPTVDAVNERAQGNPFFIEQFAASADPRCGDIPATLRDLLLSRVDQLSEDAQRVLRVAAVGGTRFGHELISRVCGMDESALESALRSVVAAQLIVVDADGGYEFRHALVREAVHDDLLPGEHARVHAHYAAAIEVDPLLVAAGRAPAEIAHHWHAAHDHPRALVSTKRAADDAARRFAYAEQARLLDRVLELWEQVPDAGTLLDTDHLDLLEEAALVAIDYGEHQRALTLTRAALCDLDDRAEPLRAARLLVRRAKLLRLAGKSDGAAETRAAYRLLSGVPSSPDSVRLMADVAHVLIEIDPVRAGEMAQEAMAAATGFDDISTVIATEITYGRVCAGQIEPSEGLPLMRSAADRARAAGDLPALSHALVTVSDALFEIGDYEQSAAAAAEGLPYADHVQVGRRTGALLLANYAEALIALGRWDDADAQLAKAARRYTPGTMALLWLRLRGVLRLARGHDGAEPLITRAVAALGKPFVSPEKRFYLLEMRIAMALATGDPHTAVSTARIAAAEPGLAARARYAWPLLVAAARAATGIDDLQQSLRDAAAPLPRRHPADHAHAAVLTALLDGGPTHWSTAVSACRTDGRPYELAQALLHLAESQAAARPTRAVPAQDGRAHAGPAHAGPAQDGPAHAGPAQDGPAHAGPATVDRSAAAASLTEARELAAALGAAPLRADIDTMARRLGLRALVGNNPRGATAPTSPAPAGTEILTAREREVLRLVAEGQSNSRIATSLFISPKTASVHVSRIIAKLDVANRVEAAAVAHRLGLLTD